MIDDILDGVYGSGVADGQLDQPYESDTTKAKSQLKQAILEALPKERRTSRLVIRGDKPYHKDTSRTGTTAAYNLALKQTKDNIEKLFN